MTSLVRSALAVLLLLAACQPRQSVRTQSDVRIFQAEHSAAKLIERGRAFASVGDTTRAQQYFAAALENNGDEQVILPMLLAVCVQDGRYRMAVEYARRYLVRHPRDLGIHFVLGTLYAALEESVDAERELRFVVHNDAENAPVRYALAVVLRDQRNDPLGAHEYFSAYLRLAPGGEHAEEARASMLLEKTP